MQELNWLDTHVGTINDGVKLINRFYWGMEIVQWKDGWLVRSGDQTVYKGDSYEGVEAFIYGMSLGYSIIPEDYIERFREEYKVD